MKQLLIALLAVSTAFGQAVPQFEPLGVGDIIAVKSSGSATLSDDATCAAGVSTTGPCPPSGVKAALDAAALNMPVLTRVSNTVATVSTGKFGVHKQPTTLTSTITLTNVTRLVSSIAYSTGTTTITFSTSDPTLRTGDNLVFSATPTKTPHASCAGLLAGAGFLMTVTSGTTATTTGVDLTTCAGAYTSGDITGGLNASAAGAIKVSGDPTTGGVVRFSIPNSLGMIYSCDNQSVCQQDAAAVYSDVPIGDLTVTGGVMTAAVDERTPLSGAGIRGGDGLQCPESTATVTCAVDASVCRIDGTNCPTSTPGGYTVLNLPVASSLVGGSVYPSGGWSGNWNADSYTLDTVGRQAFLIFADSATNSIATQFFAPASPEWNGNALKISFVYFANGGSNGQVVRWQAGLQCHADNTILNTGTFTTTNIDSTVTSATQFTGQIELAQTLTMPGTCPAGTFIRLALSRIGGDAADTFTGAADLQHVTVLFPKS